MTYKMSDKKTSFLLLYLKDTSLGYINLIDYLEVKTDSGMRGTKPPTTKSAMDKIICQFCTCSGFDEKKTI